MNANIQLTKREFYIVLAALLSTEDCQDSFRASMQALKQEPAKDKEVMTLGERLLKQLDPEERL